MEDFQIYILQVNAGLVVFYLLYRMLFSRDTFLRIRRLFLFSIVILAFVYPLISLASWLEQGNALPGMVVAYAEMLAVVTPVAPQPAAEQSLFTWQRFLILDLEWGKSCADTPYGGPVGWYLSTRLSG